MITQIVETLKQSQVISSHISAWKPLQGGTSSQVYALLRDDKPAYVVKINTPSNIRQEANYLRFYSAIPLFPRLLYVDPDNQYVVYAYIDGAAGERTGNKSVLLADLVEKQCNEMKPYTEQEGFGYLDELTDSWRTFRLGHASYTRSLLESHQVLNEADHHMVERLIREKAEPDTRYWLHGDCGIHNWVLSEGRLHGVIDPTPVVGDPIYDLIYAFCSWPDQLDKETLEAAVSKIDPRLISSDTEWVEEVLIGLYSRIGTCLMYHRYDLEAYLETWSDWKSQLVRRKE